MKNTLLIFILLAAFFQVQGQTAEKISWENLQSDAIVFEDPFEKLTEEQLRDLSYVARIRMLLEQKPGSVGEETMKAIADKERRLTEEGIDINSLLAQRYAIAELRKQKSEAVVDSLDGKFVKMAGYLLPLDFAGKQVTEFLLVPWVGACIHTPPPPKNQIVYVRFEQGYPVQSRFDPVWIEGPISTKDMAKELYLVDGASTINSGYSMSAKAIEAYKGK